MPSQVSYSLYAKLAPGSRLVGNGAPFAPGAAANPALAPREIVAYQGELSDWVLPAQVSSDTFAVSIPDGVNVHDDLRGLNYIKATVGDKELSEQLKAVRSSPSKRRSLAVGMVVVLSFLAVCVLLYSRMRRASG